MKKTLLFNLVMDMGNCHNNNENGFPEKSRPEEKNESKQGIC